jgi:hypothetical protein
MAKTLQSWLAVGCLAACFVILATCACLLLRDGSTASLALKATAQNAAKASATLDRTATALEAKVNAVDMAKVDQSLQNVQDASRNINRATSDFRAILGDVAANMPKINKGIFDLWKHTDRTLGHLDFATQQEQSQQTDIAAHTIASMDAIKALATDPNGLSGASSELRTFIAGPLTFATNNAGELENTVNTSVGHFDSRFLAPYTGSHPGLHTTISIGKSLLGLPETGYYIKGIIGK